MTLALATATLREAEAAWLLADESGGERIAGLHGGTLASRDDSFTLDRYSFVPGVELSGQVVLGDGGPPLKFSADLRVSGARATSAPFAVHAG